MGDVPLDHSQASGDGRVQDIMPPRQEPNSATSRQGPLGDLPSDIKQLPTKPPKSSHHRNQPDENRSALHDHPVPGSHGSIQKELSMADMTSALPSHPAPARSFSQQNVQLQFTPAYQQQGMMYPVHQMHYLNASAQGSPIYNVYSPPYNSPYIQRQHFNQHHQHQHSPLQPGYSPYHNSHHHNQTGATMHSQSPAYNPLYYTHHPYNPNYGEMQATPNSRVEGQSNIPSAEYRWTQLVQPSNTKEPGKKRIQESYDVSRTIVDGSSPMKQSWVTSAALGEKGPPRLPLATTSSTPPPRGPPRKPRQSGHALWVGNLPPSTNVVDLKDHFSRDATTDIESVFLISKSNCAFVNYKTEAACAAAVARFHDSRFQGIRLVCRSRRGTSVAGSGQINHQSARPSGKDQVPGEGEGMGSKSSEESLTGRAQAPSRVPERFFIIKSLTVEDLELSRKSGIWATQTHNEAALNEAYESADNVYLIFSANKSGEYFGYARMISVIADDEVLALEAPPRPENPSAEADDLDVIATEATATAPKGRIIDDSARGTIFWEADSSEDDVNSNEGDGGDEEEENEDNNANEVDDDDDDDEQQQVDDDIAKSEKSIAELGGEDVGSGGQTFGKPFRIEWVSTERLPFYRTRGLRNPWNSNREVKIARDGTEIEPSVGRKLTHLFHVHPNVIPGGAGFQRPY